MNNQEANMIKVNFENSSIDLRIIEEYETEVAKIH